MAGRLLAVRDNELFVVSFLGAAVLIAGVAEFLGVTDAIGAFMAGLILGGTPLAPRIRDPVHPLRDAFAAIFFFAFGLAIDLGDVVSILGPVAVAAGLTIVVNAAAGLIVARLHRYGPGPAGSIATTLVARGEFALILAAMAAAAGLDARLAPLSSATSSSSPWWDPSWPGGRTGSRSPFRPRKTCCTHAGPRTLWPRGRERLTRTPMAGQTAVTAHPAAIPAADPGCDNAAVS